MPANSLFPVQAGKGKLHVHIHKPIDPNGKSEAELVTLVREALLSKMPDDQHPLPSEAEFEHEILSKILDGKTKLETIP
jgi:hypothetical protein